MTNNNDKRSSTEEITDNDGQIDWVGGRQPYTPTPTGGGGYQSICMDTDFSKNFFKKIEDQKIKELKEMGIGEKWLHIAERIGFDNFIEVWTILDADNIRDLNMSYERVRFCIPTFKRYLRYRRNCYISILVAENNVDSKYIQKQISENLGEDLSLTHIKRLMIEATIAK